MRCGSGGVRARGGRGRKLMKGGCKKEAGRSAIEKNG